MIHSLKYMHDYSLSSQRLNSAATRTAIVELALHNRHDGITTSLIGMTN
jgi:hypothetical protein